MTGDSNEHEGVRLTYDITTCFRGYVLLVCVEALRQSIVFVLNYELTFYSLVEEWTRIVYFEGLYSVVC